MSASSFRKDAEEIMRLHQLTESVNVKRILSIEADNLKKLAEQEEKFSAQAASNVIRNPIFTSKIVNYAWDQSDKFLKIYVTFNGVQNLPPENITTMYSTKSFELQILGLDKKNSALSIKNLLHEIVPIESYHRVKTDMVVLYLKKTSNQHWAYVTDTEKKAKETKTPKFDEEDPGSSLMSLMKQMYEDGDDEMKRNIAKAWTEARDKKSSDDMIL